jgi:hypothetical protein
MPQRMWRDLTPEVGELDGVPETCLDRFDRRTLPKQAASTFYGTYYSKNSPKIRRC